MNFLNMQYFCVTAEELSFSKAAKRLFITQQSLSDHITRLEAEYGVELFRRTRPISLTPAGECLYRNSREILRQKAETEKILQDIRDARNAEQSIGVSTSRGSLLLKDPLRNDAAGSFILLAGQALAQRLNGDGHFSFSTSAWWPRTIRWSLALSR